MAPFNLVTEAWIPCLKPDWIVVEAGLRDVLLSAHEFREMQDTSPLVTASLHRLLIALVASMYSPKTLDDWLALWEKKQFYAETVNTYFADRMDRFDLFHPDYPFYQVAKFKVNKPSPISQLAMEEVSGNNPVLFDHRRDDAPDPIPPEVAARRLVALQNFAVGFGQSAKPEIDGKNVVTKRIDTGDGPLARGSTLIVYGGNLFETLILNTLPASLREETLLENGTAVWDRIKPVRPGEPRHPDGYLDQLTWPTRWARLLPDGVSCKTLSSVYLAQGSRMSGDVMDPMKRYKRDEKQGWLSQSMRADRALWRDSAAWLEFSDTNRPPATLRMIRNLVEESDLDTSKTLDLRVFGFGTKPGKAAAIQFWRADAISVPMEFLEDEDLVARLRQCLEWAERGAKTLRSAIWKFGDVYLPDMGKDQKTAKIEDLIQNLAPINRYWPDMELHFRALLFALIDDPDQAETDWMDQIENTARSALEHTLRKLPIKGRDQQAAVHSRGVLNSLLRRIRNDAGLLPVPTEEDTYDSK